MKKAILILLFCGLAFFVFLLKYSGGRIYAFQPSKWTSVHAGMARKEVRAILGEPTTDSFDEERLERWQIHALFNDRCLDVYYREPYPDTDISTDVMVTHYTRLTRKTALVYRDELSPVQNK